MAASSVPADPSELLAQLIAGPVTASSLPFAGAPSIADPLEPPVASAGGWARYATAKHRWLAEGRARIESVAVTRTSQRAVSEIVLHLNQAGRAIPLPVAVVADLSRTRPHVGAWTAVRLYHSLWPLLGRHAVRAPLLPADPGLKMGNPIGQYHAALRAGDLAAMLAVFDVDGYAREPSGGPDGFFRGEERLRAFYGDLFSSGAGIALETCTFTDDGVRGALEYNAVQWGRTPILPQAGVAVYERGKQGKLGVARIYDDVAPIP